MVYPPPPPPVASRAAAAPPPREAPAVPPAAEAVGEAMPDVTWESPIADLAQQFRADYVDKTKWKASDDSRSRKWLLTDELRQELTQFRPRRLSRQPHAKLISISTPAAPVPRPPPGSQPRAAIRPGKCKKQ